MNYDITTLNEFGRTQSPTETLLANWGQKNHTIVELFILLLKMQHFRALEILKPYGKNFYFAASLGQTIFFDLFAVDEKYHTLYSDGQVNTTKLLSMQLDTLEPAPSAIPIPIASVQVCNLDDF